MFFRRKKSGDRAYLQVVENLWENGRSKQGVIATLGRWGRLPETGYFDAMLASGAKFAESVMVLSVHRQDQTLTTTTRRMGPALLFERLWQALGIAKVINRLLAGRRFEFSVERAIWLAVLHRLFASGTDRSCLRVWRRDYEIPGTETSALHCLYRAMAWLGREQAPSNDGSYNAGF